MSRQPQSRRRFLTGSAAVLGGAMLAGCDRVAKTDSVQGLLNAAEETNLRLQRLFLRSDRPAPEYQESEISPSFKPNGSTDPRDPDYRRLVKSNFAKWQFVVDGLVEKPAKFTMAQIHGMPSRTQITRHDCVEGWSCIGKWKGVPLAHLLDQVVPKAEARYVVFHCADTMEAAGPSLDGGEEDTSEEDGAEDQAGSEPASTKPPPKGPKYYETIDLEDARHVQTILAYEMNGKTLPVEHGAPLRLRLERQLGYKMAKYVMRVELVSSYASFGDGKGGYWEDQGYDWYAGI